MHNICGGSFSLVIEGSLTLIFIFSQYSVIFLLRFFFAARHSASLNAPQVARAPKVADSCCRLQLQYTDLNKWKKEVENLLHFVGESQEVSMHSLSH